ncbi:MAG: hypothetical protein IPK07_27310 [Deltaproteobacteria bacterium]|nr:hypothetical protein [Deltaproteobacteria bacterium]
MRPAAKPARPAPARPAGPEPIPEGFRTVTPYLSIDGAAKAIACSGGTFGKLRDPFGHEVGVSTHVEDVAPEEMGRRMEEAMKSMASAGGAEPPEAA